MTEKKEWGPKDKDEEHFIRCKWYSLYCGSALRGGSTAPRLAYALGIIGKQLGFQKALENQNLLPGILTVIVCNPYH